MSFADDPTETEISQAVRELVDRQHETLTLKCSRCGALGRGERITVSALTLVHTWESYPAGWWVLRSPDLHVRCPDCLVGVAA